MNTSTLLKKNLAYYWRTNLAVVLGVATAVAVLAGALLVGDSVRASLRELFLSRLGSTDLVVSSTSFFREQLARDIQSDARFTAKFSGACPLIVFEGIIAHEKSGRRASGVQVYGVDDRFWDFHGLTGENRSPESSDALISAGLAGELDSQAGDSLLLIVRKPSDIPAESLHGRKEDLGRTLRLSVREVLPSPGLGEFSVRPQQGAVRTLFVSLSRLQRELEQQGKVNTMLLSGGGEDAVRAQSLVGEILTGTFELADVGIKVGQLDSQGAISLESESAIISDALADTAKVAGNKLQLRSSEVLSYLANTIRVNGREVPYSLITALDPQSLSEVWKKVPERVTEGELRLDVEEALRAAMPMNRYPRILLNEWAARDLGARPGDIVEIEYYLWEQEGRLATRKEEFQLRDIIPMQGAALDRDMVPDYPGITESESLGDWDPPFPMDLSRVRPIDEEYWDRYRTTPKAFIWLEDGQRLWQSRFGKLTSMRFYPQNGAPLDQAVSSFKQELKAAIDPVQLGLGVYPVRAEGLEASRGATDFGEYYVYFSFFLVVSALLLTTLFFKLGIEQRLREIGLLRAVGFPLGKIRKIFITEGAMLATIGSLAGLGGAIGYGWLMMLGLRTWWVDAVGTRLLTLHINPTSLVIGGASGIIAALVCIAWTLRSIAPASPRSLLSGSIEGLKKDERASRASLRTLKITVVVLALLGLLLLASSWGGLIGQAAGFFGAGVSLLVALVCYLAVWIRSDRRRVIQGSGLWPVSRLGFRNITFRPGRSVLCVALIASATFIIVAVDAFRRDTAETSTDRRSGTGGYPLLAESVVSIVHDPNSEEGKESLFLSTDAEGRIGGLTFERFRLRPGDDASCLNLYQPKNPRIIAPTPGFIRSGRFAFQSSLGLSEEEKDNPWLLLEREESDGAIPVIADANSMTYVLHLGLGDEFVLTTESAKQIRLRIVAALSDSIFQGELLMSEENFIRLFPEYEGYRFFLIDVLPEKSAEATRFLEDRLSDYGFDVVSAPERLAGFHRVENTYLSTFQTLGGLGLLLGTLGLATVLLRNVLEMRRELAVLKAVGYKPSHFTVMILSENALLLLLGLLAGAMCALLAIAPAFFSRGGHLPTLSLIVLLGLVLITGLAASLVATAAALRMPLLESLRAE
ncbi:MAG TPA: FtsX-like permease family protein [Blastocatellia bacterium]|nr:FtsX-like permease family protein [Blastocatellia bacterium]